MHLDRIFIVDPDPVELDWCDDVLTDAGFSPILWTVPVIPPRMLAIIRPAVIVLACDFGATGDGWKLLADLSACRSRHRTPLILLTATPEVFSDERLVPWQPVEVLARPVDPTVLVATVRQAVADQ